MVYNVFTIIIKLLLVNVLLHPRLLLFYRLKLIHATSTSDCSLDYGAVLWKCSTIISWRMFRNIFCLALRVNGSWMRRLPATVVLCTWSCLRCNFAATVCYAVGNCWYQIACLGHQNHDLLSSVHKCNCSFDALNNSRFTMLTNFKIKKKC